MKNIHLNYKPNYLRRKYSYNTKRYNKWIYKIFLSCLLIIQPFFLTACSLSNPAFEIGTDMGIGMENDSKIKLSIMVEGGGMPVNSDEDPILHALEEKLNVDMDFQVIQNEYTNSLNIRIAGGTAPDLFSVDHVQMYTYANQDLLLDLTPYTGKMPRVQAVLTPEDWVKGMVDGKLVAISKRPYMKLDSLWIRKDWLDNLNLEIPATIYDFVEVAKAFTYNDPDQNGMDDTFGYTSSGMDVSGHDGFYCFSPLFGAFGTTQEGRFYIKRGQLIYSTEDPAFLDALNYIKSFIKTGAVDPEILSNKNYAEREKAFSGQVGMIYIAWTDFVKGDLLKQMKAADPDAKWIQIADPVGPGGSFDSFIDLGDAPGRYAVPADIASDKLNKVMEFLNYIASGEGYDLVCYGLEREHYVRTERNKIIALNKISEVGYSYNYQLIGRDEFKYYSIKYPLFTGYRNFAYNLERINVYNGSVPIPAGFNIVDLQAYEEQTLVNFLYGNTSLSQYDDFLKILVNNYRLDIYKQSARTALEELGYLTQ